jgi:hypothetical protein
LIPHPWFHKVNAGGGGGKRVRYVFADRDVLTMRELDTLRLRGVHWTNHRREKDGVNHLQDRRRLAAEQHGPLHVEVTVGWGLLSSICFRT